MKMLGLNTSINILGKNFSDTNTLTGCLKVPLFFLAQSNKLNIFAKF